MPRRRNRQQKGGGTAAQVRMGKVAGRGPTQKGKKKSRKEKKQKPKRMQVDPVSSGGLAGKTPKAVSNYQKKQRRMRADPGVWDRRIENAEIRQMADVLMRRDRKLTREQALARAPAALEEKRQAQQERRRFMETAASEGKASSWRSRESPQEERALRSLEKLREGKGGTRQPASRESTEEKRRKYLKKLRNDIGGLDRRR